MIVVIGAVAYRPDAGGTGRAAGLAAEIAAEVATSGSSVELVARVGEDGAGEDLLLALARAGVGHLAILRDPARPTALAADDPDPAADWDDEPVPALLADVRPGSAAQAERPPRGQMPLPVVTRGPAALEPADVSMGLEYLRDFRVIVAVEPVADGGAAVIAEAAAFGGAALVVVTPPGAPIPDAYGDATLIEAPEEDPEGAFAGLVGRFTAGLDRGVGPGEAFRAATMSGGWELAAG